MEDELIERKRELEEELRRIETQIYQLETTYLESTFSGGGNVIRGLEGFVSFRARASNTHLKRAGVKFKETDRWFSGSSATSKIAPGIDDNVFQAPATENGETIDQPTPNPVEKKKRKEYPSDKKRKKKKEMRESEYSE